MIAFRASQRRSGDAKDMPAPQDGIARQPLDRGPVLGRLADATSINFVYQVCAFLPAIGLLTGFLPNLDQKRNA